MLDHITRDRRHRRHPRQLLAVGGGRPRHQAPRSTCRSCRPSTPWPGSRPRPATPSPQRRIDAESEVIACSDAILASCSAEAAQLERFYGARPERIEIVPPGRRPRLLLARRPPGRPHGARPRRGPAGAAVRRAHPAAQGPRRGRRRAGRAAAPGRRAGRRWAVRAARRARPSWPGSTTWRRGSASRTGSASCRPQPHHLLSTYYRAADVCVVPSRSESFGLVALEAAACGTPVVAAAVGGLATIVEHGAHRPADRGPRPGRLRRRRRRPAGRPRPRPRRWARRPPPGPAATRGPPRPPACAASTPTSPSADWSTAPEDRARCERMGSRGRSSGPSGDRSAGDRELDELEVRIDGWLAEQLADNPVVAAIDRDEPASRRWFVRLRGEQKDTFTVWFTLRQRTLHYETYVMPAPEEQLERVLRAPAAAQPEAVRRGVRHRAGERGRSSSASSRSTPSTRASSTASSVRCSPTSSSSSGRRCASASPSLQVISLLFDVIHI